MRTPIWCILLQCVLLVTSADAQSVLFDFDAAPLHSPLPLDVTVSGITAHLSATGEGFSIQEANTLGFTPIGFAGNCIYPSSVFAADLLVGFSANLTDYSILYAPEEYGCDSSALMRVTAYFNSTLIGTNTATAQPGTWPSATLALHSAQAFNRVVVHYDAPPPTGGDWGPVFMADNMLVMPVVDLTQLAGDFNRDQQANAADLPAMMAALVDLRSYQAGMSLTDSQLLAIGDLDHDSSVTNADLQTFLGILQSSAALIVPEPCTATLMAIAACTLVWLQLFCTGRFGSGAEHHAYVPARCSARLNIRGK